MRDHTSLRRSAALTYGSLLFVLLLAGFGCTPGIEDANGDGLADGIQDPNGVSVVAPAGDSGMDPNAPVVDEDAMQPPVVWIVGSPETSFAHVQPGVKSEFYVDFTTGAGADLSGEDPNAPAPLITITLDGPGVMGDSTLTKPFQPNHDFRFTFPINRFGEYEALGGLSHSGGNVHWFTVKEKVK